MCQDCSLNFEYRNSVLGSYTTPRLARGFSSIPIFTDPLDVSKVERLRKQQQAERENQEVIQTQRMDSLKLHYESCVQGEERATHPYQ